MHCSIGEPRSSYGRDCHEGSGLLPSEMVSSHEFSLLVLLSTALPRAGSDAQWHVQYIARVLAFPIRVRVAMVPLLADKESEVARDKTLAACSEVHLRPTRLLCGVTLVRKSDRRWKPSCSAMYTALIPVWLGLLPRHWLCRVLILWSTRATLTRMTSCDPKQNHGCKIPEPLLLLIVCSACMV